MFKKSLNISLCIVGLLADNEAINLPELRVVILAAINTAINFLLPLLLKRVLHETLWYFKAQMTKKTSVKFKDFKEQNYS